LIVVETLRTAGALEKIAALDITKAAAKRMFCFKNIRLSFYVARYAKTGVTECFILNGHKQDNRHILFHPEYKKYSYQDCSQAAIHEQTVQRGRDY
jgi:hypothetical protein